MRSHAVAEEVSGAVIERLNGALADAFVLYAKTRNYHWNVTGPQFHELHKVFEEQYEALNDEVDELAERVRALGARPLASLAEFAKASDIRENPGERLGARGMLERLLQDHRLLCRRLGEAADLCESERDRGSVNLLEELIARHEKTAWMLGACLESAGVPR